MAWRKARLWPIMGIPSEPGGSPFADDLLLVRRRKIGKTRRKIINKAIMFCRCKRWGKTNY
ncbi:hypothetical protein WN944_002030 [Citrus x changshan-huyou]|uniref:Uncharacterized protein n=1 Tax=Citrus x changshan-huyou TaxID=2935761 RepID=A0AAP0MHK4_9ROSI